MIGLGTSAAQLDTSVNIAFPAITQAFDLSIADIQWVVISYVLTYASLLLALGRIGDTVGHARVFRIGLAWSTVALLLVGWSPSFGGNAAVSLPAGHRRSAGAELRRGAGHLPLWRGAAQPGARHLHHDARGRLDAWSPARRRADVGLGLAGGVLVPGPDRRRGAAVVSRHAGIAAAAGRRSLRHPGSVALVLGLVTMLFALNRMREFSAVWFALLSALAFAAFIVRERRAARPIIAVDSAQAAGVRAAQSRQRAAQSRGLFGLAAGGLCPGARAGLQPDRKRRHPGDGCGRGRAGGADRRPACGSTDFRPAPRDRRRRGHAASACC